MKIKLLFIILAVSLGFNLFFTVGYFNAKKSANQAQGFKGRIELAAKKLSLDDNQKKELFSIVEISQEQLKSLKSDQKETIKLFKAEFKKPSPDIKKLKIAMKQIEHKRRETRKEMSAKWREFFRSLSMQQRNKIVKMLRTRPQLRKKLLIPAMENSHAI